MRLIISAMNDPANNPAACQWTFVGPIDDFANGSLTTVRLEDKQLVLVRRDDGAVFALDNKCPHEGYALSGGDLKGDKLTCCWHNWKFDINDGSCLIGGEGVRSYDVRIQGEHIEVDLADPSPESQFPALLASFDVGLFKHENDRAARDGIRLLQLGYSPWELMARIAHYDALHAEYGTTHAAPVAADCGRLFSRLPGPQAMYAIVHAIDMCGDANARRTARKRPEPRSGGSLEVIRSLAESEKADAAEALLLGAIDGGTPHQEIERWLHVILSDHFTGFGHPLIYLVKIKELLNHVDPRWARDIYGSLLYRYILSTREDTLPYMKTYREHMDGIENELPALFANQNKECAFDSLAFRDTVLDSPPEAASLALRTALEQGIDAKRIASALVAAGATRMLRFDPDIEKDPRVAETWVWVTHRFTHACAILKIIGRNPGPDSLRFLFHGLAFINSGKRMDLPESRIRPLTARAGTFEELVAAIGSHNAPRALAVAKHLLESDEGFAEIKKWLEDMSIQDVVVRPIVVAHLIKTTAAAIETYYDLEDQEERCLGILAVVRFLAIGIKERRVHDMVTSSIEWLVDGKIPRKLTQ